MEIVLLAVVAVVSVATFGLCLWSILRRSVGPDLTGPFAQLEKSCDRIERTVREEIARNRDESAKGSRDQRQELLSSVNALGTQLLKRITESSQLEIAQLEQFQATLQDLVRSNEGRLVAVRDTLDRKMSDLQAESRHTAAGDREASAGSLKDFGQLLFGRMTEAATAQTAQFEAFSAGLAGLTRSNRDGLDQMREAVERKLTTLQADNSAKLEQMRATVDEKLHATLETRLGESFKLVSDRLELVHKGLGEMQSLANGVGDLKKVLTNVKTRGNWGEVQLGNLLEQMLTPDQYSANVQCNPETLDRVEFAIKLPGRDEAGKPCWLPLDAKFPQEDYQRLVEAADRGDAAGVSQWSAALEARVCGEAKKIREKYINAPHTTDFAVLFLPTEGLFAEVLRRPGLCDGILHDHRIVLAGPTTLSALLSSLQMGFRTLVIEKRSSEVWQVLGNVKTEFGKFGDALDKVKKKLQEATNTIDEAGVRSRAVKRKLQDVEAAPVDSLPMLVPEIESLDEFKLA